MELRSAVGGHHEAIGIVERRHRDIKRRLRALSDNFGVDWESHLSGVVFSLNHEMSETATAIHPISSSSSGMLTLLLTV